MKIIVLKDYLSFVNNHTMKDTTITVKKINKIKDSTFNFHYTDLDAKRIKKIERIVRKSFEYRIWTIFLKTTLDVSHCAFYEGYSMSNSFTIELHHYPITLYDITYAIAHKHLQENGFFTSFGVAYEVCRVHYLFQISVVPLSPTAHKLYHDGLLPIHPDLVKGSWNIFLQDYKKYISEECKASIQHMMEDKEKDATLFPKILHRNEVYLEVNTKKFIPLHTVNIDQLLTNQSLKRLNRYNQ